MPLTENHFKDLIRESFKYEENTKKLVKRMKRKIKNESLYIFGVKKTAKFCKITEHEMNKHMKAGHIKYIKDNLNRSAFQIKDLIGFVNDIESLREEFTT